MIKIGVQEFWNGIQARNGTVAGRVELVGIM